MAEYVDDVIDIPELIGYVRELEFDDLRLDGVLPNQEVDDIEYELLTLDAPVRQVASYRAWDTPPPLGKRPGFSVIAGEIPPLGKTMRLNEKELLRLNELRAGTPGAGDIRGKVWDDAANMTEAVQVRVEIARGDILTDGIVSIDENGMTVTADFDVPAANFIVPAIPWSDHANATPITDIQAALVIYRTATGGRTPAFFLTSSEVIADLLQNAQIRNLAPVTGVVPGIITVETMNNVLRSFGLPLFVAYDTELPDANETYVRVINERKVIAVPNRGLGNTFYGITPDAAVMAGNGTIQRRDAPGVIAFVETTIRPAAAYTTGAGIALPVLRDPASLMVLTV